LAIADFNPFYFPIWTGPSNDSSICSPLFVDKCAASTWRDDSVHFSSHWRFTRKKRIHNTSGAMNINQELTRRSVLFVTLIASSPDDLIMSGVGGQTTWTWRC
jgi:hypothetical protein